jgi:hypothetical protein
MNPGNIRFATHAFHAPRAWNEQKHGECATLHVRQRSAGTCESAWYPTPEELALLNLGEPVILTVWGGQPPVSVNVNEGEKVDG